MDPKASWRKYMTLIPSEAGNAVEANAQAILVTGGLKRRRPYDADEDERKNAKRKLTEENSSESPFLRLPAEIRRMIFAYVLGGQYIHVEQLHLGSVDRYEKKDIHFGQGLWNEICHNPHDEQSAYDTFRKAEMGAPAKPTGFGMTPENEDIGQGYHIDSWTYRHWDCGKAPELHRFNVALEEWKARDRLSLAPLRTCKLIHKEMRLLPYTDNNFLFRSPSTFQVFMKSVRPEQFRALQHLSIPIAFGSAPFSEGRNKLWTSVLSAYNMTGRIRKLKYLDITVELYFPRHAFTGRQQPKPQVEDCLEEVILSGTKEVNVSTNWVAQFSALSRQAPTYRVVVADDPLSMWGVLGKATAMKDWRMRNPREWMNERNVRCLTIEQKQVLGRELAERLRGYT